MINFLYANTCLSMNNAKMNVPMLLVDDVVMNSVFSE